MLQSVECVDKIWMNIRWYKYPVRLQKHLLLTIMRLQSPIVLSGYGLVECTLETFVAVRHNTIRMQLLILINMLVLVFFRHSKRSDR